MEGSKKRGRPLGSKNKPKSPIAEFVSAVGELPQGATLLGVPKSELAQIEDETPRPGMAIERASTASEEGEVYSSNGLSIPVGIYAVQAYRSLPKTDGKPSLSEFVRGVLTRGAGHVVRSAVTQVKGWKAPSAAHFPRLKMRAETPIVKLYEMYANYFHPSLPWWFVLEAELRVDIRSYQLLIGKALKVVNLTKVGNWESASLLTDESNGPRAVSRELISVEEVEAVVKERVADIEARKLQRVKQREDKVFERQKRQIRTSTEKEIARESREYLSSRRKEQRAALQDIELEARERAFEGTAMEKAETLLGKMEEASQQISSVEIEQAIDKDRQALEAYLNMIDGDEFAGDDLSEWSIKEDEE